MTSNIKIRLIKAWQTEDGRLIWQINPYDPIDKTRFPKKLYLIISSSPKPSVTIADEKPSRIKPSGQFVSLIRKYMPSGSLIDLWLSKSKPQIKVLQIASQNQIHYISTENSRPPVINLITGSPLANVCRLTPKACYTKKQLFEEFNYQEFEKQSFEKLLKGYEKFQDEAHKINTNTESENLASNDLESTKYQRESIKRLKRRRKTFEKTLSKSQNELNQLTPEFLAENKLKATLLQNYAYLVKPGDFSLELTPAQTGLDQKILIDLDPDKKPGSNIEAYFKENKKNLTKLSNLQKRTRKVQAELSKLNEDIMSLEAKPWDDAKIIDVLKKHGVKPSKQESKIQKSEKASVPFRKYVTDDGTVYLVGKGPKENDELTKKAKSNDHWIHTSELPGAHVIIPRASRKNRTLSREQIKRAGMLSIHFSKLREGKAGEVYVTTKHFLKKKKGLPAGMWIVEKSETTYIKYTENEIKALLDCLDLGS